MDNFPISNAFQIKPELDSILQSETVKGLISKVLNDTLLSKCDFGDPETRKFFIKLLLC